MSIPFYTIERLCPVHWCGSIFENLNATKQLKSQIVSLLFCCSNSSGLKFTARGPDYRSCMGYHCGRNVVHGSWVHLEPCTVLIFSKIDTVALALLIWIYRIINSHYIIAIEKCNAVARIARRVATRCRVFRFYKQCNAMTLRLRSTPLMSYMFRIFRLGRLHWLAEELKWSKNKGLRRFGWASSFGTAAFLYIICIYGGGLCIDRVGMSTNLCLGNWVIYEVHSDMILT